MKSEIDFGFENLGARDVYERLAVRIAGGKTSLGDAIYDIGLALAEAKTRLGHGMFLEFLRDDRVKYEPRAAQILMKIARADDGRILAGLGVAKAVQLLRVSMEKRSHLLRQHNLHDTSVARLRELIEELLGRNSAFRAARKASVKDPFPTQIAWAAGVLQLSIHNISSASIHSAFRELAKVFHPDKGFATDGKFVRTIYQARDALLAHVGQAKAA